MKVERNNLKKFREINEYTQKELAGLTGISYSLISKLETGERNLHKVKFGTIQALAEALGCTTDELLFDEFPDDSQLFMEVLPDDCDRKPRTYTWKQIMEKAQRNIEQNK